MTAIECLKILKNGFIVLVIWNLLITGYLMYQYNQEQEAEMNRRICNLEAIPTFEIIEVE